MELKRKAFSKLFDWKNRSHGETALLIEGARRAGKSWLAQKFAREAYDSFIYIDFANLDNDLIDIFRDTSHLDLFFLKLQAYFQVDLQPRRSLIIFDEVQLFPKARQLIKYLVADGRFDYLETGSLISLRRNIENIVVPSEEEVLPLHPLDFEEFLWAANESQLASLLKLSFESLTPLGAALHRKTLNLFRLYLMTGGMPQAVVKYFETRNLKDSDIIKRNILRLYRTDVTKFAKGYESKVLALFDEMPSQLTRHEKKFKLSSISKAARYREYEDAFMWLAEAKIVNLCFNATDPTVGLNLNTDRLTLKCYSSDTGLLLTQAIDSGVVPEEDVLKAVTYGRLEINEGMLIENVVAQMLAASGHKLYFYSRPADREKHVPAIEIDFLIRRDRKICPIEVKSSVLNRHASLDAFVKRFNSRLGTRYILCTKDIRVEDKTVYLPLYMAYLL